MGILAIGRNGKHKNSNRHYGEYSNNNYQGRTYDGVPRVVSTVPEGKKLPRSIIAIKKEHESKVLHLTQKPVELLRYLILTYTDPGDVVLDNCIGSGTTAIAAMREGRHFIGFELNKEYYDVAAKRIKGEQNSQQ